MTFESFVLDGMKILMVAVWGLMGIIQLRIAVIQRKKPWDWVRWGLGIMGIYWALYYARSLFGLDLGPIHQVYVRGPLLLTGGLLLSCGIITLKKLHLWRLV